MSTLIEKPASSLARLRWQWAFFFATCVAGLLLAHSLFRADLGIARAWRWLFQASLFAAFPLVVLWRGLPENHRIGDSRLLTSLGIGNLLTASRGVLIAGLAGFLFLPRPEGWLGWVPGGLFTGVILSDIFDGYLARRYDQVTDLGGNLDLSLDGLAVLVGSCLLVQYGQVPAWYLLVGLSRYLFLFGSWVRRHRGLAVHELTDKPVRRQLAGSQMGFIAVVLFPVFSPPATYLAAGLFAFPFLAGFLLDWFAVSESANRQGGQSADSWLVGFKVALAGKARWALLVLRIVVGALVILWLSRGGAGGTTAALFMFVLAGASAALLALGAAGRLAALGLIFSIGLSQQFGGLGAFQVWLIAFATAIFYLGTGPYSLWVPEKNVLVRRPGEK